MGLKTQTVHIIQGVPIKKKMRSSQHRRWGQLRDSRRALHEHSRAALEAERENAGPLGPACSATRAVALAESQQTAERAVKEFLENAGKGPDAVEARKTAMAAATAVLHAHEAVTRCIVEAGAGTGGDADNGAAAAASEEMVEIEREGAAARISACEKAIGGWWARQKAATEDGLHDREAEAEERR